MDFKPESKPVLFAVVDTSQGGLLGGPIVQGYGFSFEPLAYKHADCAANMADHLNTANRTNKYAVRAIY